MEDEAESLRGFYGLYAPICVQYATWITHILRDQLGFSFEFKAPVRTVLGINLLNTILLGAGAIFPYGSSQNLSASTLMNEITKARLIITNEIDMVFSLTMPNYKAVVAQDPNITTNHYGEPPFNYEGWWPVGLGPNTERTHRSTTKNVRWAISLLHQP